MGRKRKPVDLDKAGTPAPLAIPESEARTSATVYESSVAQMKTWFISVPYIQALELVADTEADAWREYCNRTGLRTTSHKPVVRLIDGNSIRESDNRPNESDRVPGSDFGEPETIVFDRG